jgi:hypothetical protein
MPFRIPLGSFVLLCLASPPAVAVAQETGAGHPPPKILQIYIESVKPGKGGAHEKIEVGWPAAFAKAKWSSHYIGMTSMSGLPEAWFVAPYESFAAVETDQQNVGKNPTLAKELDRLATADGDVLTETRGVYARYRPELSYKPEVEIGKMRYLSFTIITLKPGNDSAFADTRKLVVDAHVKAGLEDHFAVYEVVTGMPSPAYLLVIPMRSLQEVDAFKEIHDAKAYRDAMGEPGRKQMREFAKVGVASAENRLLVFSPKMSYPAEEWVASDPEFWKPKVAAAAKP